MDYLIALSYFVLMLTAGVLFYAAVTDLKDYKIPNELILVLAGLFFLHAALSGRWVQMHWNLGFALLMSGLMMVAYAQKLMGGGDLKILAVAFLWVGTQCALPFAVLLLIFGTAHAIAAKLRWVSAQQSEGRTRIAFAPSVAGALIGTFLLGCLEPFSNA